MPDEGLGTGFSLRDYLAVLRRRWWIIGLVAAMVVAGALWSALSRGSSYRAEGEVVVDPHGGDQATYVATQLQVMQSQAVQRIAEKLLPDAGHVDATQSGQSNALTVGATRPDPRRAAAAVNAHLDAYIQYLQQQGAAAYSSVARTIQAQIDALQRNIDALDARAAQVLAGISPLDPARATVQDQFQSSRAALTDQQATLRSRLNNLQVDAAVNGAGATVVDRATPPTVAASPKPRQDALLGLGAGLLLGIALAFLFEYFDDSIQTREDLHQAGGRDVAVIGVVPAARRASVASLRLPSSAVADAYRSLRTAASFAGVGGRRTIQMTSPSSREGTTETLLNLAVASARTGQRVVVVDCNLRSPRVHRMLELPNDAGFSSVVSGVPLSDALQRVGDVDRLYALTAGPEVPNPSELLSSPRCAEVLDALRADNTLVLVDTPPLLRFSDAVLLAGRVDGVVVVVRARDTSGKHLRQSLTLLRQVGARVLGTVLQQSGGDVEGYPTDRRWRRSRLTHRRARGVSAPRAPEAPRETPAALGSTPEERTPATPAHDERTLTGPA